MSLAVGRIILPLGKEKKPHKLLLTNIQEILPIVCWNVSCKKNSDEKISLISICIPWLPEYNGEQDSYLCTPLIVFHLEE